MITRDQIRIVVCRLKKYAAIFAILMPAYAHANTWIKDYHAAGTGKYNYYDKCNLITTLDDGTQITVKSVSRADNSPYALRILINNMTKLESNTLIRFDNEDAFKLEKDRVESAKMYILMRATGSSGDNSDVYRPSYSELLQKMLAGSEMRIKDSEDKVYVISLKGITKAYNDCMKEERDRKAAKEKEEKERAKF